MDFQYESFDIFLYIQCNFSKKICDELYKNLSTHIWNKWLQSNGNILIFINRLDKINRNLLLDWGSTVESRKIRN
jgi:Fe-S cluster biosynthesis and repair protein YggX